MLVCVSANHRSAGFAILNRLAAAPPDASAHAPAPGVRGAVVVATCNRVETYLDLADDADVESAVDGVLARLGAPAGLDAATLTGLTDRVLASRVPAHLFAVASGLESVVVGEEEIAGQVRRAVAAARAAGTMTPELERLFRLAASTSKDVRRRSRLNDAGRSLVRLALDLAASRVGDWASARIAIIGSGAYAGATLAALRARGAGEVLVTSPSGREAQFAATRPDARAVAWARRRELLAGVDVVITSTVTRALDAATVRAARGPSTAPLLVVDLGMPANVDPAVADLDGVELLDLATIARHAPVRELEAAGLAREAVSEGADAFAVATAHAHAAPAIVALRGHVHGVLERELTRQRRRGTHSPETEQALRHFAAMLLHEPSTRARHLAAQDGPDAFADAIRTVFGDLAPGAGDPPERATGT